MLSALRFLIGLIVVPVLLAACSDSGALLVTDGGGQDPDTQNPVAPGAHTQHTGPSSGVWPPQPQDLTDAEPYPSSAREGVMTGILDAARRSILNNPEIKASLGDDFREIEATFGDSKSSNIANFVFYNYASDETLDVSFDAEGAVLSEVYAAEEYQPAEHPQEKDDAISLARAALVGSGFDVTDLEATAMLAFPPVSSVQSEQRHFYPQRTLYVTFGTGDGALPVYTALVDLSAATVTEHGLVK